MRVVPLDANKWENGHQIRAMQAVLRYGVGAMVNFPEQILVSAKPDGWEDAKKVLDDRFAKSLRVKYFKTPRTICYERFPEWYYCPHCRRLQPLKNWLREAKHAGKKEDDMIKHLLCSSCNRVLVPSQIVTVCKNGHLNDFPWVEWVHTRGKKLSCKRPALKFRTNATTTEGLENMIVECTNCGAMASLRDATTPGMFEQMDRYAGQKMFACPGHHPFRHEYEKCQLYPRAVPRGSSSVYFPLNYSSIVIPPYADKIYTAVEQSLSFEDCEDRIYLKEKLERESFIKQNIDGWSQTIAKEIGAKADEVKHVLEEKWLEDDKHATEISSIFYRMEEYKALTGEVTSLNGLDSDFIRTEMDVKEYDIPFLKSVALIEKARVVSALVGFSRLQAVSRIGEPGFVDIKDPETDWYPANEVRGEGIFLEFDHEEINKWLVQNPGISERVKRIQKHYNESFEGSRLQRKITAKFVLLHTLSHLLIKQLSFECGYNIASLSERLYCSELSDGTEMSGILIYTSSGDSEGTLGGLVRQGRPDTLPKIFKKAINEAKICSNDPICIMSKGQGRESLNLAACHVCALLPETSCEERNSYLDRAMLIGTYEQPEIGLWYDLTRSGVETKKGKRVNPVGWGKGNHNKENKGEEIVKVDVTYELGDDLRVDYPTWQELGNVLDSFDAEDFAKQNVELPSECGGEFLIGGKRIAVAAAWTDQKVVIIETKLNDMERGVLENKGWRVYDATNVMAEEVAKALEEK